MKKIDKLIDMIGKYFQIDIRYFLKNSSYLAIAWIISLVVGLVIATAFPRLLSVELYGKWNYILSIIGILSIINLPNMRDSITQSVARGYDGVYVDATKTKIKWGLMGSIILFFIGIYYFLNNDFLFGKCFIISALLFPFYDNFQTYAGFLNGKKLFSRNAKYQSIILIITTLVTISTMYVCNDLSIILITYLVSLSLTGLFLFKSALKYTENSLKDKEAISFGKHMSAQNIPGQITSWGDRIIIGLVLGFPALAIYSVAKAYSQLLTALMNPILNLALPKLAPMDEEEAYSAVKQKYPYFFLMSLFICVVAILLSPYLVPLLFTSQYEDSVFYSQLIIIALIFGIPTSIFIGALFPSQRKVRELYKIHIFLAIVEMSILIPFAFLFGILGIIFAKIISNFFTMIYSWILVR